MRFVKDAKAENARAREASRARRQGLSVRDLKLSEDKEWAIHDFGLRPHFGIDDLKKFNGIAPGSRKLDAMRSLTKFGRPRAGTSIQLKTIDDAIDTLYVMENAWELFLVAYPPEAAGGHLRLALLQDRGARH
eukprot:12452405-Alexandrium_andersonii.AAC.1